MCLAIYKPANIFMPEAHLRSGFEANFSEHCGSGMAWCDDGKLNIVKGIFTFKEFLKKYEEASHRAMLIHFRLATHNPVNQENCHPFPMCDGQFALIHNGVFPIKIKDPNLSDTGNFCKYMMEPLIKMGKYTDVYTIERLVGWNMFCLMGSDGKVIIYNENYGHWSGGVWYSNHGYNRLRNHLNYEE